MASAAHIHRTDLSDAGSEVAPPADAVMRRNQGRFAGHVGAAPPAGQCPHRRRGRGLSVPELPAGEVAGGDAAEAGVSPDGDGLMVGRRAYEPGAASAGVTPAR
ncbi:hypothetical protein [Nocardia flavorosea]|uniref:Uncharacterized protein n=1 Tax=Nocardia flavorosea TaxID=53429 RepID=A0A846YF69_9NOCA|nr:hypothetical protein [Nocardia flavorosea]NKY56370.1 hypothetical protein [Nocardia flavorosea]